MWGLLVKYTDKETQACWDTMPNSGSFENHYKNMTSKSQMLKIIKSRNYCLYSIILFCNS